MRAFGASAVVGAVPMTVVLTAASPASADGSTGSGSQVVGYTVTAEGIGAQFGFNIPNLIPLPNENLLEADLPFARSLVSSGPQVDAIGTPYYPGDILGNFGGLASEFFPPQFPNPGNWPILARAQYPPNPTYKTDANFGGTAPAGSPVSPAVFAGTAHAAATGSNSSGTLSDLMVGPGMGPNGAPALDVGSIQSSNTVSLADAQVSATANAVVKTIAVAGMLDITQITSDATSTSDGTTATPDAHLHLGQVTVNGQQAFIDDQGVHVVGNGTSSSGAPTPSQVQSSLNTTLAQDGISVRLLDPQKTTNSAEGIANSGGLVVSIAHNFSVPFINTGALTGGAVQPCVPTQNIIPGQTVLGDVCLPAGNYTAVTSVTLGLATTDVTASAIQPEGPLTTTGLPTVLPDSGTSLPLVDNGDLSLGTVTGPGAAPTGLSATGASPTGFAPRLLHFPIRGIPAPVGWVAVGLLLCVLFAYPMMLAARWQFLVGRR
ncbi:MAG TPA: hypothetical protein VKR22_02950 [Acidimicrobiales bacterium]|nr:hypothetical protein [Acidimicrobiales bacterium]